MLSSDRIQLKKYYDLLTKKIPNTHIYFFDNEDMYSIYINKDEIQDVESVELLCEQVMEESYSKFRIEESDTAKLYVKLITLKKIDAMECRLLSEIFENPQSLSEMFGNPQSLNKMFENPQSLSEMFGNPQSLNGMFENPQSLNKMFENPQFYSNTTIEKNILESQINIDNNFPNEVSINTNNKYFNDAKTSGVENYAIAC